MFLQLLQRILCYSRQQYAKLKNKWFIFINHLTMSISAAIIIASFLRKPKWWSFFSVVKRVSVPPLAPVNFLKPLNETQVCLYVPLLHSRLHVVGQFFSWSCAGYPTRFGFMIANLFHIQEAVHSTPTRCLLLTF